jgi:hypothetical protein
VRQTFRQHPKIIRSSSVQAKALFGRGGSQADEDVAAAALDIGKRFGGPSASGNDAVANLVRAQMYPMFVWLARLTLEVACARRGFLGVRL